MKNLNFNTIKKVVLGAFLTLLGAIPATQVAAHAPGGPEIPDFYYNLPEPVSQNRWHTLCNAARTAANVSYTVATTTYDALSFGSELAYEGACLAKKASILTYRFAQKGFQATKWAAAKSYGFYKWATGKDVQEAQAAVKARFTVASSNFF